MSEILYIVHYASQSVVEIIDEIKNNKKLSWNETIVIITSDNGAAPAAFAGYAFGSALPLRGTKGLLFFMDYVMSHDL